MRQRYFYILLLIFPTYVSAQTISGNYYSYWAQSCWEIDLFNDNTFWFKSSGHYGNTRSSGKYQINEDTIILNSVYTDTIPKDKFLKISNNKFLVDGDSCIVDVELKFDYCKNSRIVTIEDGLITETWIGCRKRNTMYPQLPTNDSNKVYQVERILQKVLDVPALQKYYLRNNDSVYVPLVIESFYEIKANNGISLFKFDKPVVFMTKQQIKEKSISNFIEIEEFDVTSYFITVNILYRIKKISLFVEFYKNKNNNQWEVKEPFISDELYIEEY